jgi:hypothetical protein
MEARVADLQWPTRLPAMRPSWYRNNSVFARLSRLWRQRAASDRRELRCALLLSLLLAMPVASVARANAGPYRLALLELESDDVHDNFAKLLTERLRAALSERSDYELRYAPVSLAQLSLAHDCDTSRADCLATIARELKLDGFIFGKATHEGGTPVAVLRRYDLRSRSVDRSALVTFASLEPSHAELERGVQALLAQLLDPPASQRHTAGSQLLAAAETDAHHDAAGASPLPAAPPAASSSHGHMLAYSLLAASVVSAGMAIASFVWVDKAAHDSHFNDYRLAVGDVSPTVRDVCAEASADRNYGLDASSFQAVKNSCSVGTTFEVLQYVFIASTVVAGGFAAYLLASDTGSSDERGAVTRGLRVRPQLGQRQLGLDAVLRF